MCYIIIQVIVLLVSTPFNLGLWIIFHVGNLNCLVVIIMGTSSILEQESIQPEWDIWISRWQLVERGWRLISGCIVILNLVIRAYKWPSSLRSGWRRESEFYMVVAVIMIAAAAGVPRPAASEGVVLVNMMNKKVMSELKTWGHGCTNAVRGEWSCSFVV